MLAPASAAQVRFTAGPSNVLPLKLAPSGAIVLSFGADDTLPSDEELAAYNGGASSGSLSGGAGGLSRAALMATTFGLSTALFSQVRRVCVRARLMWRACHSQPTPAWQSSCACCKPQAPNEAWHARRVRAASL